MKINYICTECSNVFESESIKYQCPKCNGIVLCKTEISNVQEIIEERESINSIWDCKSVFPEIDQDYVITLGEGGTPCRVSKRLGKMWGIEKLYLKDETQNPTNSFKDRAAALLISHARSLDFDKVVCASNGNQGASIAAYASLEGIKCVNIIPEKIDVGKKAQMIAYNSKIHTDGKYYDDALNEVKHQDYENYYQTTPEYNPLTIEGQKTIAYEILNQIGTIDGIIIPMGSGGLLISIWKGYKELKKAGYISQIPKLIGVQSTNLSPIVNKFQKMKGKNESQMKDYDSHALGILVKNPFYGDLAVEAIKESNGTAISIQENLMLSSAEKLANNEGIFAEPSSALTVAALNSLLQQKIIQSNERIVCLITGSGLKTPYMLEALSTRAKTAGMGGILSTKLEILSQINATKNKGIYGSKIKEIMGTISLPAIYQHLKELESKELISRRKEGKTVYYTITKKGKKVLNALEILIALF
ncbi:MAG: threonine synthase [Promethearchaeota archaeon]|nr:MAG: threonine synthase [Candidatus Lokiarchaeota archaeon]